MLVINPLSDVLANMFSHSVGCLYFVDDFLCCAKIFKFDVVQFVYFFSLFPLPGGDIADKNFCNQYPRFCCLSFLLGFLWFGV